MSSEPPKRHSSTELTAVLPRDSLPPRSGGTGPTIEQLADIARARRDAEDAIDTMVPCPLCEHCPLCRGLHMVTPTAAANWNEAKKP